MPELLFFLIQRGKLLWRDHVLDANQSCVFGVGIIEEALPEVAGNVGTVVVCWNGCSLGVGGENMEGVEVGADVLDWSKVLERCGQSVRGLERGG